MTRDVRVANPNESIQEAARMMADIDAGAIPVGDNDRLVGMLTDRDIAVRAIAEGRGPDTRVGDVMTHDVRYCFEADDSDEVCRNLGDQQIRRIPVVSRDKRLVGILSLGDLAREDGNGSAGDALGAISQPGGRHSQSSDMRH
jgi:CBS domain-containing protein